MWHQQPAWHEDAQRVADQARLKAAHACEQRAWVEEALALYAEATRPPARERRARLLRAQGRGKETVLLAEEMAADPRSPEEAEFAHNLFFADPEATGPVRQRATRLLRDADTLELAEGWKGRVEAGAAAWYRSLGWGVVHAENGPWRQVVGALCWDLFNGPDMGWHHALQRTPDEVLKPGFYQRHRAEVEQALAVLDDPAAARARATLPGRPRRGVQHLDSGHS